MNLDEITTEDSQEIGRTIANLEEGDKVQLTNDRWDFYVSGTVREKVDQPEGKEFYKAIVETKRGDVEVHANWRDIPPDSDDQETPFTGAIIEPFNNTAPAVTDISVGMRSRKDIESKLETLREVHSEHMRESGESPCKPDGSVDGQHIAAVSTRAYIDALEWVLEE